MVKRNKHLIFSQFIFMVLLISMVSCAHVISRQVRKQTNPDITFEEVLENPEEYTGQMLILSGVITEIKNTKEGTILEVLQTPANFRGKPADIEESEGRYLAIVERFLDPSTYAKGRSVTVAGKILGKRIQPLGKTEYTYPFIQATEIYLWPVEKTYYPYRYYPYDYPYSSYYAFDWYYWRRSSLLHRRRIPRKFDDIDRKEPDKDKKKPRTDRKTPRGDKKKGTGGMKGTGRKKGR
jgi:outer membrane lipoprotein